LGRSYSSDRYSVCGKRPLAIAARNAELPRFKNGEHNSESASTIDHAITPLSIITGSSAFCGKGYVAIVAFILYLVILPDCSEKITTLNARINELEERLSVEETNVKTQTELATAKTEEVAAKEKMILNVCHRGTPSSSTGFRSWFLLYDTFTIMLRLLG